METEIKQADGRGRLALGAEAEHRRYRVELFEDGSITAIPIVRELTAEEVAALNDPEFMASLNAGIADAGAGRVTEWTPAV